MSSAKRSEVVGAPQDLIELNPGRSLRNDEFCFKPDKTGYPQIMVAPKSIYESAKDENGVTLEEKCFYSQKSSSKLFRVQFFLESHGGVEYGLAQGKFLSTPVYLKFNNPKK